MRVLGTAAGLVLLALPARADLEFVQIVQAQSDQGREGLFGKSWVEMHGSKMRMVSGYARKLDSRKDAPEPRRVIQLLDVKTGERLLLDPEKKTYSKAPVSTMDYGNKMTGALQRPGVRWSVSGTRITLKKQAQTRRLLGTQCAHYHLRADFTIRSPDGRSEEARLDQHVWTAPLSGGLAQALMDLIAFENAYRSEAGGNLSPLDHERYQLREAAAYLRVRDADLREVVERVRERLRDLPSYPVASSVSWYRTSPGPKADSTPKESKPVSLGMIKPKKPSGKRVKAPRSPRPRPGRGFVKPRFQVIRWHNAERRINKMYRNARGRFPRPLAPPRGPIVRRRPASEDGPRPKDEPVVYPRFEEELQKILAELVEAEDEDISGREASDRAGVPFYEIYAELHGLERASVVDSDHLELPAGYRRVPYRPGAPVGGGDE